MSPPTQSWANDARGWSCFVGTVPVAATGLPSVDLAGGNDLAAELSQALLGVGVVVVRLLQLGGIVLHNPGRLQVQRADHLDYGLKTLVERPVTAVRAGRAAGRHDRLERRRLGGERARRVEQVGHHDLEPIAATATAYERHCCLRASSSRSLTCQRHVPGSASGSSTTLSTPTPPMIA